MPQLDTSTFPSQLFWLVVCFLVLYVILSFIALPKISRVLGKRAETVDEKINKASLYREQAEDLLVDYEKTLAQARDQAHQHYKASAHTTASQIASKQNDFLDKLNERLHVSQQELYRARLEVGHEINSLAMDVANGILTKVMGPTSKKEPV